MKVVVELDGAVDKRLRSLELAINELANALLGASGKARKGKPVESDDDEDEEPAKPAKKGKKKSVSEDEEDGDDADSEEETEEDEDEEDESEDEEESDGDEAEDESEDEEAELPTESQVNKALKAFAKRKGGKPAAMKILAKFKVKRVAQLKPSQYAKVIALAS